MSYIPDRKIMELTSKIIEAREKFEQVAAERDKLRDDLAAARALLQKQFYYAPGNYSCLCRDCGKEHVADKRAQRCLECADKRIDAALSGKDAT
jgi:hypothetical protein